MEKSPKDPLYVAFGIYGAVGIQWVLSVVLGLYAGSWGDKKWGTSPWLMIVGVVLGAVAGFYNLIRITSRRGEK